MEASAKSFIDSLWNIFEALRQKESATVYEDLLRKIFDKTFTDSGIEDAGYIRSSAPDVFYGKDDEKKLLLSKILDTKEKMIQLSVIPIVGRCGSGKTALARSVYEDRKMKNIFKLRAWVKVDGHELRLNQVGHGMLKSAMGLSCSIDEMDELDEIVADTLQSERCLIVFDGIESLSEDSWHHMVKCWFGFVDLGSVVLVTTCCDEVADLVGTYRPFEPTPLSESAAWSLTSYYVAHYMKRDLRTPILDKNLEALCGGNPLSLQLLASLMRYHHKLQELLSSVDLSESMPLPAPDASAVALLCVWALPPYLRKCFGYCSIFPKGYTLNKEKIIRILFAHLDEYHNYLDDRVSGLCVAQLHSRLFFTDITYNENHDIVEFRMPNLIHEIAKDIAKIVCEVKLGVIESIAEDVGTLSFAGNYNSQQLQTLILSPTIYLGGFLDHHSLAEFTELRSLDLSSSGIRVLSKDVCSLKELRYLNLSYTCIEKLPDSITDLQQLRTLDLSWCYYLKFLPKRMRRLRHMTHLDLSRCESLSYLPSGIGSLVSLKSMPLFVLGVKDHPDCASLGDLEMLDELEGMLEIRNLENAWNLREATDALRYKYLHHLALSWSCSSKQCDGILELLEPNRKLKVLDLTGYMGFKIPQWISSMNALVKLSISDCGCKELPSLGHLRCLKELQLKGMRYLEFIGAEFYGVTVGDDGVVRPQKQLARFDDDVNEMSSHPEGRYVDVFPSLEQLGLFDLPKLLKWSCLTRPKSSSRSAQYVFRRLKTLTVEGCPRLERLPVIPNLSHMIVGSSSSQILSYLTSLEGIPSILIKDMKLERSLQDLCMSKSVEELILFDIHGEFIHMVPAFPKHLGILHCHQLRVISWSGNKYLKKVRISDCQNLEVISVSGSFIEELVVEDCPQATTIDRIPGLTRLRKLIIKSCSEIYIHYDDHKYHLKTLEYLLISGCPNLERRLQEAPSLISHIQYVVLGNEKIVLAPTPS